MAGEPHMMIDSSTNLSVNYRNNIFKEFTNFLPVSKGLNDIAGFTNESNNSTSVSGSPLEAVGREAEIIASDVIISFTTEDNRKPPNKYCKTMRRTVKELLERHNIVFKGMVMKLNVEESNAFQTFVNIADEIFDDGQINWGRIVAVYAFAVRLAKHCQDKEKTNFPQRISLYVGKYVGNKLGSWILDNGGWEAFAEHFPDQGEFEDKVWKGLLFTAVGLGALATVVAAR